MSKSTTAQAATQAHKQRQTYLLLLLGILFLVGAWLLHPSYPVGVFLLGLGMLVSTLLYPGRLLIAGCLTTALGVAVFLFFAHLIPGNQVFPAYTLGLGVGLLAIALLTRRGSLGVGALSPALIVIAVGIIEALLLANLTPPGFLSFMLSLWLPGFSLLILGVSYFLIDLIGKNKPL